MEPLFVTLAVVVAVAAAIRSTWSPCGTSMLSTITPHTESARGHRYTATASWFVLGAVVGGATLGAAMSVAAWAVGTAGLSSSVVFGVLGVAALVAAASDARVGGFRLPGHRRQVNELWFGRYRPWVYASGFGWQIGVGLATFITTAGVYVLLAAASLTGSPAAAFALCALFGLVRGLAVFAGWRLSDATAMLAFHRRFDALAEPSRWATVAVLAAVAIVSLAAALGPVVAAVAGAALLAGIVGSADLDRRQRGVDLGEVQRSQPV